MLGLGSLCLLLRNDAATTTTTNNNNDNNINTNNTNINNTNTNTNTNTRVRVPLFAAQYPHQEDGLVKMPTWKTPESG